MYIQYVYYIAYCTGIAWSERAHRRTRDRTRYLGTRYTYSTLYVLFFEKNTPKMPMPIGFNSLVEGYWPAETCWRPVNPRTGCFHSLARLNQLTTWGWRVGEKKG